VVAACKNRMIHPSSVVHPSAKIASDVEIGPLCVIGPDVEIGPGCRLLSHVTVQGPTRIGARNLFHPFVVVGGDPQDLSFKGERVSLVIGDDNTFRECVTLNRGTTKGGGVTTIGNRSLIMAYCHIAHDCVIEDGIVMANNVQIGGHCRVEEGVGIGGNVAIQHFVTVGRWAFVGGMSGLRYDVPPYSLADGVPAKVRRLNLVGLKRRGLSTERIEALKKAYRALFRLEGERVATLKAMEKRENVTPEVRYLIQSLRASMQGKQGRAREALRTW
jgi:UDP-N-acetylglucosamine acyltransferase